MRKLRIFIILALIIFISFGLFAALANNHTSSKLSQSIKGIQACSDEAVCEKYPHSIMSFGDSLTRGSADNRQQCSNESQCLEYSWATGVQPAVTSLYNRLVVATNDKNIKQYNYSVGGHTSLELPGQLTKAAGQKAQADLVTILIGNNDLCNPRIPIQKDGTYMVPAALYQSTLQKSVTAIRTYSPNTKILILSPLDYQKIWNAWDDLGQTKANQLRDSWKKAKICQDIWYQGGEDFTRITTRSREYIDALRKVCSGDSNCFFDDGKNFDTPITVSDLTTVDYLHPSASGQARIAEIGWSTLLESITPKTTEANNEQ